MRCYQLGLPSRQGSASPKFAFLRSSLCLRVLVRGVGWVCFVGGFCCSRPSVRRFLGRRRLFRPPYFRRILTFNALFAQKAPTRRSGVLTGLSDPGGELFSWAGSFRLFLPSFRLFCVLHLVSLGARLSCPYVWLCLCGR